MKIKLTFKDPDGVYESLKEAAVASVRDVEGLSDEEKAHRAIAAAMGFKFDERLPVNCLRRRCWTERLLAAADREASRHAWY
jgi:hypothetical protein